jgi:hypothetical protein
MHDQCERRSSIFKLIYICMNIFVTLKDHYMDIIMNAMLTYK